MNILVSVPVCEEPGVLFTIYMVKRFIQGSFIVILIILMVLITIDIFKLIISNGVNFKEAFSAVSKRIIASVLLFLVPGFVFTLLDTVSTSASLEFNKCYANSENVAYFRARYEELEAQENKERKERIAELQRKIEAELDAYIKASEAEAAFVTASTTTALTISSKPSFVITRGFASDFKLFSS